MLCLEQDVGGVVGVDVLTLWEKKCFMIGGRDRGQSWKPGNPGNREDTAFTHSLIKEELGRNPGRCTPLVESPVPG